MSSWLPRLWLWPTRQERRNEQQGSRQGTLESCRGCPAIKGRQALRQAVFLQGPGPPLLTWTKRALFSPASSQWTMSRWLKKHTKFEQRFRDCAVFPWRPSYDLSGWGILKEIQVVNNGVSFKNIAGLINRYLTNADLFQARPNKYLRGPFVGPWSLTYRPREKQVFPVACAGTTGEGRKMHFYLPWNTHINSKWITDLKVC